MHLEHERYYGFGHGFFGERMHLKHERYYGFCMGSLVIVCSWNTNVIVVRAWILS